jgi:hypothetical protein|tara:strand:+ start:2921 stop:3145 length:225 start_codon:yes stop_codon:yes gene_type:complete
MHNDKAHQKASKGQKIGVVGESHIWDGPLNQGGRLHGSGSSSGITGMEVSKFPESAVSMQKRLPITQIAKGKLV